MANEILSYLEMCQRERPSLQRGMNFRLGGNYSVILMSLRVNAPYEDAIFNDGTELVYEGHDSPKTRLQRNPKLIDQPEFTKNGARTENGKFYQAASDYKRGSKLPEKVRVYEKIFSGIWSFNGLFELVDAWKQQANGRQVFKYRLLLLEEGLSNSPSEDYSFEHSRIIPSEVKRLVWQRDKGHCVMCGAKDELHFDHIIPYSKGGTSLKADNIQLLCARHNLQKRDKIE